VVHLCRVLAKLTTDCQHISSVGLMSSSKIGIRHKHFYQTRKQPQVKLFDLHVRPLQHRTISLTQSVWCSIDNIYGSCIHQNIKDSSNRQHITWISTINKRREVKLISKSWEKIRKLQPWVHDLQHLLPRINKIRLFTQILRFMRLATIFYTWWDGCSLRQHWLSCWT
jgi:hypothetical protein